MISESILKDRSYSSYMQTIKEMGMQGSPVTDASLIPAFKNRLYKITCRILYQNIRSLLEKILGY